MPIERTNNQVGAVLDEYCREVGAKPLMTREEELLVTREYKETRSPRLMNKLVEANLRFVSKVAFGYSGYGIPVEDLIQEGNVGLIKAVERFDPERGFRLISYAKWWIRAAIQYYIMKNRGMVRVGSDSFHKQSLGDRPDLRDVYLGSLGREPEDVSSRADIVLMRSDVAPSPEETAMIAEAVTYLRAAIEEVSRKDDRDRQLLEERMLFTKHEGGKGQECFSERWGVAVSRVGQIESRCRERLAKALPKDGLILIEDLFESGRFNGVRLLKRSVSDEEESSNAEECEIVDFPGCEDTYEDLEGIALAIEEAAKETGFEDEDEAVNFG